MNYSKKIFILLFIIQNILNYQNLYELTDPKFLDELKSHFEGKLVFQGVLNSSDYEGIEFLNSTFEKELISTLKLNIDLECDEIIHIKITDLNKKRWDPSNYTISNKYKEKISKCKNTKSLLEKGFELSYDNKKSFSYKLKYNNEIILDSNNTNFLFTDKFIVFGEYLSTNEIYGFGERYHDLNLEDGIFTIWPNDSHGIHEDLNLGGDNLMGHQPLGFHRSKNNNFLGILFNNVNAQDILIKTLSENNILLEHRFIGGIIDYYIYPSYNIDDVLVKLHNIIGNPTLMPYWSLGFHQSRWGYKNTNELRDIYNKFIEFEFPIDTFWGDIEILDEKKLFTIDPNNFFDLPLFVNDIQKANYKFVPIVDIALVQNKKYEYYIKGHEENAFILSNYTNVEMVCNVWGGASVFPDFFTKQAKNLWKLAMNDYYKLVNYDGIWLDMNEPATINTLQNGRVEILPKDKEFYDYLNEYEYLSYIPGYIEKKRTDIRSNSISENSYSVLYNKSDDYYSNLITYNFKPLINLLESEETYKNLIEITNKRPFILSRSTTLGSSKYGFHWLGDNNASYNDLKNSLSGIFQFNIYGIPFIGDDICGFQGKTNDNLCARWMSLGSFYPFSRNHKSLLNSQPHEPFAFGINSNTYYLSKISLKMRYSLIRYYYSQLFKISLGEIGSFFKPVFFNYYNDTNAYFITDICAMIGDAFILFPVLSEKTNNILAYFPNDDWNFFSNFSTFIDKNNNKTEGNYIELPGDYKNINLFFRGGYIIPYQNTFKNTIRNTFDLNNNPTDLIINVDSINHFAQGDIVFDDDSPYTIESKDYLKIHFEFMYDTMNFGFDNLLISDYNMKDIYLGKIKFLRMKYLESKNISVLRISLVNRSFIYAKVNLISNDVYEVDINRYNLRFDKIRNVKLIDNKEYMERKKVGFLGKKVYFE